MPRRAKGARLLLRQRKGRDPVYVIKDEGVEISTRTGDRAEAETQLSEFITRKNRAAGPSSPDEMAVAEALAIYGEEHAPHVADPERIGYAIDALMSFWGDRFVSDVKGSTTRLYVKRRGVSIGTARRELGTLRAALAYCGKEGYLTTVPSFPMPAPPETSQRAMTRDEVAKLLWLARRNKHIARFILISLYTGTRKQAVLNLALRGPREEGGWFDLRAGVLYRIGTKERATKKKRTPVRLPRQLLAHARRWGGTWAVEWKGSRCGSIKTAWNHLVRDADLGWHPTPHTLKHTAITWGIERGMTLEDAAGFFSTSRETIERVYWHLSPHFQQSALDAIESRPRGPAAYH